MEQVVSGVCAVIPSLLLLRYFYKRDLNPEPRGVLIKTFLLGVLIVIPVWFVVTFIHRNIPSGSHPFIYGLYAAFLCAAIPEEFFKFLVIELYSSRNPAFDEPMDGVVYGAAASLGFAALENIIYVAEGGWPVAILRAFTAVPCHACLGGILGYYVGQARFNPHRRLFAFLGLGFAILLHGLYNLPVFVFHAFYESNYDIDLWTALICTYGGSLAVLCTGIFWVLRIVKSLRRKQVSQAEADYYTQSKI